MARGTVALVALTCAVVLFVCVFGNAILNGYGKRKAERLFAQAHPGFVLRIDSLDYSVGANRMVARSVTLSGTNTTLKVDRISLTGVRWARACLGKAMLADVLAKAELDATNLVIEITPARYGIRCSRLRTSVPAATLVAEGTELRPLMDNEAFFGADQFRTALFRVLLPECRVSGLAHDGFSRGKSFEARLVEFFRPSVEVLINRDKPPKPFVMSPPMVQEALASIPLPMHLGILSITNGLLSYCERLAIGADPAVITIGAVSLTAEGIANRGDSNAVIQVQGEGYLMNAGLMKMQMTIPITSPDFSFHYSGSLGAMDLTRLDGFLDIAERTRIKSGSAQAADFEIDVTDGHARGRVRATYKDLEIAMLDKQTGSEKGLGTRVTSLFANMLKVRNANAPVGSEPRKEGEVNYTRRPDDEFQQFAWFALRTGVLDIINFGPPPHQPVLATPNASNASVLNK